MTDLAELGADVEWPDGQAAQAMRELSAAGSFGRLDELAEWLASLQGVAPPRDLARARIVVFGGSPCSAGIAQLADAAVLEAPSADGDLASAVAGGAALADNEIEGGADLFVVAVPQAGVSAAVLVAVLTNTEPVKVMSRGAELSPQAWMEQAVEIRDGRHRAFALRDAPDDLLAEAGTGDLAAATGFLLRAAARRTPALLDGIGAAAAALVGHAAQPRAGRWWQSADGSGHPAHELALVKLGQRPLMTLGITAADGTAGALALLMLRAAVHTAAAAARSPRI